MTRPVAALLANLLRKVEASGRGSRANIVAFSGGVDSSLVAKLVREVFPSNAVAAVGVSAALSSSQLANARDVAANIGIELHEVETAEGVLQGYLENKGQSCYYCKRTLYETLSDLAAHYGGDGVGVGGVGGGVEVGAVTAGGEEGDQESGGAVLYNGTNRDDGVDPTRVGLKAAAEFKVSSPLSDLSKDEVRAVAKHLGLPNWNLAAAPCLVRFGVAEWPLCVGDERGDEMRCGVSALTPALCFFNPRIPPSPLFFPPPVPPPPPPPHTHSLTPIQM